MTGTELDAGSRRRWDVATLYRVILILQGQNGWVVKWDVFFLHVGQNRLGRRTCFPSLCRIMPSTKY